MSEIARIGEIEVVPTRQVEPIMSCVATCSVPRAGAHPLRDCRHALFRSRRSALSTRPHSAGRHYGSVRTAPRDGGVNNWTQSWHGIQDVVEQCSSSVLQAVRSSVALVAARTAAPCSGEHLALGPACLGIKLFRQVSHSTSAYTARIEKERPVNAHLTQGARFGTRL